MTFLWNMLVEQIGNTWPVETPHLPSDFVDLRA